MFRLVLKEPVYLMLDEAYWWYEEQLSGLGERLLADIGICFEKLSHNPHFYSIIGGNYRQVMLRHFPYKVVFEIDGGDVVIYAVYHTSRNPDKMLE